MNKQKKIIDKQNQELAKLYNLNKKKKQTLKDKKTKAQETLGKIEEGFDDILDAQAKYRDHLEFESSKDKNIAEEEPPDMDVSCLLLVSFQDTQDHFV